MAYCELYDHGDATFTLNVKPQEAGRHALTIKYAGEHVPGSPFTLRVSGAPDASKVVIWDLHFKSICNYLFQNNVNRENKY